MSKLRVPVTEKDHAQGPANAPVTLVEYGDYECPHCGHAYPIVKRVQEKFGERLRFVFRNFPLQESHPHAVEAAEVAEFAGAHEKFWEMHDLLFENQRAFSDRTFVELAHRLKLDVQTLAKSLQQDEFAERVQEDFSGGARSGVNGTPTFFINGVRHDADFEYETLVDAITQALGYKAQSA